MKRRDGNTGIMKSMPRALSMRYDDKRHLAQLELFEFELTPEGLRRVGAVITSAIPSGSTSPSSSGAMRSLLAVMKLRRSLPIAAYAGVRRPKSER
jgi:hypothetical protein